MVNLNKCIEDDSINCFCVKEDINFPTDFRLELLQNTGTNIILRSSRIKLNEKSIDANICLLIEPETSSINPEGSLTLLYGNNKIINENYEGSFDPSLVFYKSENNEFCILSTETANFYDSINLECSEKDESFDSLMDAISIYDAEIDSDQLSQYISLASLNANFIGGAEEVIKGIIYLESFQNGIFINREIVKHQGTGKYIEGNGKGISSLNVVESGSAYESISLDEGRRILNLYGYNNVEFNDDYLSAILINDPEFSISLAYVYLLNEVGSFSDVKNTNDIFEVWLNYYHRANIDYDEYVNKINLLNSHILDIGTESSQILNIDETPHLI